jgi:hypothetical protein
VYWPSIRARPPHNPEPLPGLAADVAHVLPLPRGDVRSVWRLEQEHDPNRPPYTQASTVASLHEDLFDRTLFQRVGDLVGLIDHADGVEYLITCEVGPLIQGC